MLEFLFQLAVSADGAIDKYFVSPVFERIARFFHPELFGVEINFYESFLRDIFRFFFPFQNTAGFP